jgi:hypothetical protein
MFSANYFNQIYKVNVRNFASQKMVKRVNSKFTKD